MTTGLFDGFESFDLPGSPAHPDDPTSEPVTIHGRVGGAGPALLLLHGYPQTHVMWHKIAPVLAERFRVVVADLRGYGASGNPPTTEDHAPYSKRAMAADMVSVMQQLGHDTFLVAAHDRGARVAHRLAADHPELVEKLAVLDIAPTREMYRDTTDASARAYWHWFFLIQKHPFPEWLIESDPVRYWDKKCGSGSAGLAPFTDGALAAYRTAFSDPANIHSSCEDYRAAATIDVAHDDADGAFKLPMPVLCLWGAHGVIEQCFDPLALWRERAEHVIGRSLPGGHYLAEEVPDLVLQELLTFLS